jgi:hypothetical protein
MSAPNSIRRAGRWWLLLTLVLFFFGLVALGFYSWTQMARYPAEPAALAAALRAEQRSGWIVFSPSGDVVSPPSGVIIYPGGLVDALAYARLAEALSGQGVLSVVVPMPLELAIFGVDRANAVIDAYPDVQRWLLVGHSLGGAMAAEFVGRHPGRVAGLALLAAYPASNRDLSSLTLPTLSVLASADGLTSREVVVDSLMRLPADTRLLDIRGGNHAQFGDYGPQRGDGEASMSAQEQQGLIVEALLELILSMP